MQSLTLLCVALGATTSQQAAPDIHRPATVADARGGSQALYFGEVDDDGLEDVLSIHPTGQVQLFLNFGQGRYEDITVMSGLANLSGASCALFVDLDGDGLEDLFLGSSEVRTWRNLGNATFRPFEGGIDHNLVDLDASALDLDQDGLVDLRIQTELGDVVYRNLGDRRFERVELPIGMAESALGAVVWTDTTADVTGSQAAGQSAQAARNRIARWSRGPGSSASSTWTAVSVPNAAPAGGLIICASTIVDAATNLCIGASSIPTTGSLLPLGGHMDFDDANNGEAIFGLPGIAGQVRVSTPGGFPGVVGLPNDGSTAQSILFRNDSIDINPRGGPSELLVRDNGEVTVGLPGIPGAMQIATPGGFPGLKAFPNDGSTPHAVQFLDDAISINPSGGPSEFVVHENGRVDLSELRMGGSNQPFIEAKSTSFGSLPSIRAARADGTSLFYTGQVSVNSGANTGYGDWCSDPSSLGRAGHYYVPATDQGVVFADVKNFRQTNPRDPSTDIVYACVEGPEAAAYARGTATLEQGSATVALPQHFSDVAISQGLTVQVTPRSGASLGLAVISRSATQFVVHELHEGAGTYDFDWEVKSVRNGFEDYKVIRGKLQTLN